MKLERLHLFGETVSLSWAVRAGHVVHVAGMVGMKVDFDAPEMPSYDFPEGVEAQMRQAYANIGVILGRFDAELTDIAQQTLFFVGDGAEVAAANKRVRRDLFGDRTPASAMVGVSNLFHPECLLEIQAIAYPGAG
ncbi:RidA family protein [Pseudonocardia kujensis]|uniref:RidA family protein n=1 Tax=Pseudonocardia kujensis TaxID=1128675 RepID=UPI001E34B94A|nr:RidA family protein [Pseudonocardia kujensis]MCE0767783.1 RidA family protein [Pseudonocardia kujensis]